MSLELSSLLTYHPSYTTYAIKLVSCHAKPAKKPADKTSLDER
jgi:hypothetical protein